MASTVKPHQRAFALTIALIFLITTVATSVFVVMAIIDENKNTESAVTNNVTPESSAQQKEVCGGSVSGKETLPTPDVYKPAGDVTALEKTTLTPGNGAAVKKGDCVVAKYYGTLATNGEVFDENFSTDTAFSFPVGASQVIQGWDQGLVGAKVGETLRLVIPSDLAYGESNQGTIPANADLVFVVKVLEIKEQ